MDDLNNNNDSETIILYCNVHLPDNHLSNFFFESHKYEAIQNNSISLSFIEKSCNTLLNGLFKKLFNSNFLDFIYFQDLFNVKNIQELDTM